MNPITRPFPTLHQGGLLGNGGFTAVERGEFVIDA